MFSLESPRRGDSNENTQYTIFDLSKENHPKFSEICRQVSFFFQETQERVRNSRGKRAISVRAIKVLLYLQLNDSLDILGTDMLHTWFHELPVGDGGNSLFLI